MDRKTFPGLLLLGLGLILTLTANDGACGSDGAADPGDAQCKAATDCAGLPHVLCPGQWQCTEAGKCNWTCGDDPAGCQVTGCSGEVCAPAAVDTNCVWKDWFACIPLTTCGAYGAGGKCAWDPNPAFLACLQGEPPPPDCTRDDDCGEGQRCVDGACATAPQCDPDHACPPNSVCKDGQCVLVGPECTFDGDCAEGLACLDGYCKERITGCTSDSECRGDGMRCEIICLDCEGCGCFGNCVPIVKPCVTDLECPEGTRCIGGACTAICDANPEICNGKDDNCDGYVDEGCVDPPKCQQDGECLAGEACIEGTCRVLPGYCWTNQDCAPNEFCSDALRCPEGAPCYEPDHPGKCVAADPVCKVVQPGTHGECKMMIGWIFDGNACVAEGGCTCEPDCRYVFPDQRACLGACMIVGETCKDEGGCPAGSFCDLQYQASGEIFGTCQPIADGLCVKDADCGAGARCFIDACPACFPCPCFGKCVAGPKCTPVKPYTHGPCDMVLGVIFDGQGCTWESGCSCEPDCGAFFKDVESCRMSCASP